MPRKTSQTTATEVEVMEAPNTEVEVQQPVTQTVPVEPQTHLEPIVTERDEFCSSEYLDPFAKLPRIQALRGNNDENCGYFVSIDQMAAAGWIDFDESQLIDYNFEMSGAVEKGILIRHPRMLVCPKTPVLGFDHEQSEQSKSTVILGRYTSEMSSDPNIRNLQFYNVFLLDAENKPLHQIPLSYKAKGANQATFAEHWQQFCREITACHAIANGIPAKPKNALFYSLAVFCLTTSRELAGSLKKGNACKVASHEVPNLQNWKQYFLGYDQTTKAYIHEALEPQQPLMVPGAVADLPALPAGEG
ncbi:DUF5895 domain-containing protein [Merismopedia glauca]|uniref:DUF5895 domain-containing protein n=1 Tax=Merismopedia glauca CCAP 1448/3 TaxID=1296344 RepID=A0A2T1BZT3_9CYAN|nr:DUF5895 domain-containing protein [Merismopedia glauca]PSB01383.1 hypothetical protein C7B64_18515 [Merismopedia glauca CCAP 1448/3]